MQALPVLLVAESPFQVQGPPIFSVQVEPLLVLVVQSFIEELQLEWVLVEQFEVAERLLREQ